MANDIPKGDDSGSLGNLSLSDDDLACDDEAIQSDNWIEELECALLADCDPATLKKICEGKRIPASLRPDYWRTLLALNDAGKVKLTSEYDLPNQQELRHDCEQLVEDISQHLAPEPLPETDKLRLRSDFESTLTTYVKARPELHYVSGNGWIDILKVLYSLQLSDTQMYQMFFRIVDRYIPKDLSPASSLKRDQSANTVNEPNNLASSSSSGVVTGKPQTTAISKSTTRQASDTSKCPTESQDKLQQQRKDHEKSIQAYHLLRLLIQYHDPELCSILDSKKVTPNLYVKDWFCSLFARSCPAKLALHMWDMHFKMADPFLIFFAAIVMVVNASDELKKSNLSQADMLNALKRMPSLLEEDDVEDLYYLVSNHYTNSTPRSIRSYSHLFFMDTFGATYTGNESPELSGTPPLVDLKTCRLTSSLDLSQYLCLPIVPAEIFALESVQQRASPEVNETQSSDDSNSPTTRNGTSGGITTTPRYFLVDCRPAEQYNAGHLTKAFHLDCSLMLREPSSFATAVQALLEIQRQVVASKSNTGGQHLCFIGSGQDEEDRYVNMVVASFLQKYQKYVSIVYGGFDAIHDYVKTKSELSVAFNKFIVDHNEDFCKACCSKNPEAFERLQAHNRAQQQQAAAANSFANLFGSTSGFFAKTEKGAAAAALVGKFAANNPQATATAQQLAQQSVSMFDKFTTAFVSKSSVFKDRLVETLNSTTLPTPAGAVVQMESGSLSSSARSHVSSQDKLGPRYMGSGGGALLVDARRHSNDALLRKNSDGTTEMAPLDEEPCQEIQVDQWQRENQIIALYKCAQIRGNAARYPGYVGLNKTHLWILREIPHNKGFASIAAKRPLNMVVQITSKRRQPDFIIFRYGYANTAKQSPSPDEQQSEQQQQQQQQTSVGTTKGLPTIIASDHLHIPQAFEVIRLIKREIVRIMDENSRAKASEEKNSGAEQETAAPSDERLPSDESPPSDENKSPDVDQAEAEAAETTESDKVPTTHEPPTKLDESSPPQADDDDVDATQ